MANALSTEEIELYMARFRQPEIHIESMLQSANIWQTSEGRLQAEVVLTRPASEDFLSHSVSNRAIYNYVDYLVSWLDMEYKQFIYSTKIVNTTEIITITFTK